MTEHLHTLHHAPQGNNIPKETSKHSQVIVVAIIVAVTSPFAPLLLESDLKAQEVLRQDFSILHSPFIDAKKW